LREAVDHGLPRWAIDRMATNPDLKPLYNDPRFTSLLVYAKKRSGAPAS
jgi:hypothetical protein